MCRFNIVKTNRVLDRKFELIACTMREFLCAVDFSNTGQNFITRPGFEPPYMILFGNVGFQGKMPCSRGILLYVLNLEDQI